MNELIVYLRGRRAGRLFVKDNGNLQFRYDETYDGRPVSNAMPVRTEGWDHRTCVAVFGGLLPEGESRNELARIFGTSPANDFRLLAILGGDCAGALVLLPPDEELSDEVKHVPIDPKKLDELIAALPRRPLAANPDENIRMSLAGAQPKLVVAMTSTEVLLPVSPAAASTHIIKPEPSLWPGLVDNEAFCMDLALRAGLRAADVSKHATTSGKRYLSVVRYDRETAADPVARIHQEDFCQALRVPSAGKYQEDGGPGTTECFKLIGDVSVEPFLDIQMFWEALVLAWLIGNCDAHAKNYSLLYGNDGARLAPLYDQISTLAYPEHTRRLAMSIGGSTSIEAIDLDAWRELGRRAGFTDRFSVDTTRAFVDRAQSAAEVLVREDRHQNASARQIAERVRTIKL